MAAATQPTANVPTGTPWETALLDLLGAPPTAANYKFLNEWQLREHGDYKLFANNPFFTSAGGSGSARDFPQGSFPLIPGSAFPSGVNTAGIPQYPDVNTGVVATERTLEQYPSIAAALKSGNPGSFANDQSFQSALSTWSGHSYTDLSSINAPSTPQGPGLNVPLESAGAADFWSGKGGGVAVGLGVGSIAALAGEAAAGAAGLFGGGATAGAEGAAAGGGAGATTSSLLSKLGGPTGVGVGLGYLAAKYGEHWGLRLLELLAGTILAIIGLLMLTRGLTVGAAVGRLKP